MLLAEPTRTPYDFQFELFGFPVRVNPFFWVAAAVIGWGITESFSRLPFPGNPGKGVFLVLWIAAMFVSILIHELGHAFAFRFYGIRASIVLYHFGGLAIPDTFSSSSFGTISRFRRRQDQLVISAAGPAAQLLLAAVVIGGVELAGYAMIEEIWPLNLLIPTSDKPLPDSIVLWATAFFLAAPSVYWALLNLLPVYPLDGGQIARELFVRSGSRNAVRDSLGLSLFTAIGCALYAYTTGDVFIMMLFISLGVSSYQLLQAYRMGGGPW